MKKVIMKFKNTNLHQQGSFLRRRNFIHYLSSAAFIGFISPHFPLKANGKDDLLQKLKSAGSEEEFWKLVRNQFPLTKKRTYFNTATVGPSPYPVLETIKEVSTRMETWGEYYSTDDARESLAKFVNVTKEEISLTHNTTEGINLVAWGLPLKRGDEVIMTTHEHVGNALPWLNRAKLHGIVLKTFTPAITADENLNLINDLIGKKTKVIAVPHITCTTGLVLPVKQIAELGHDKGLFVFFDGAQALGSTVVDLEDMGVDFYATCTHKWLLGPNGTGFLYVKKALLDVLQVYGVGAYSESGWELSEHEQTLEGYVPTAHRYDYGTQNAAIYQGVVEAVNFMNGIGIKKAEARGKALSKYLQDNLLKLEDKIEMLTPTEDASRGCIVGFRLKNMDYHAFGKLAGKNNFRIRLVPEAGLHSIRISTHIFNSYEEIDRFLELIGKI
ncbi:MAG: aminotransferase class V-fold PLP-dependent enzyme [Bacteroidetes bacterium]|nr:aminotransferase class V-fold PLP-dependent enzyme [Bacteroidota bacterium]